MPRKIAIDSWVETKDSGVTINKSKWIADQIRKSTPHLNWDPLYEVSDDELKTKLHNLVNNGQAAAVKEMKAAWSREKYKAKNKSNTFALSKDAHRQLRYLVKENKTSIKQTLEDLILDNYTTTRAAKVNEKEMLQKQRAIPNFRSGLPLQERKFLERDHDKTKKQLVEQHQKNENIMLQLFEQRVFLEDLILSNDLNDELLKLNLTKEQREEAMKAFIRNKESLSEI